MRIYCFGNFYLSSIQQGIQGLHALGELVVKYGMKSKEEFGVRERHEIQSSILADFLCNHKTAIVCNGGAQKSLQDLYVFFKQGFSEGKNDFPYSQFKEEQDALNGALTCVAIVLPARIYEFAELLRNDKDGILRFSMEEQFNRRGFACYDMQKSGDPSVTINNRWEYELAQLLTTFSLAK
jgi:hypothetical protein